MNGNSLSKKLNIKFLNQLKLMIKPQQRIIKITQALLTLLGGTVSFLPFKLNKADWASLKSLIKNPEEIIEIANDHSLFLKRVRIENVQQSYEILNEIPEGAEDEVFDTLLNCVKELQGAAQPLVKRGFRQGSLRQKTNSFSSLKQNQFRSQSNSSFNNNDEPGKKLNTMISMKEKKSKRSKNPSRTQSPQVSMNSSISKIDFKQRVQLAHEKKVKLPNKQQTRLERILKLHVQRPQVSSTLASVINGDFKKPNSQPNSRESMLRGQIELTYKEIRKLKVEENDIKWQIERESKSVKSNQVKEWQRDDIQRYKISFEKEQELKQKRKLQQKENQRKVTSKTDYSNRINIDGVRTNTLQNLQQECILANKRKEELEQSLMKIRNNITRSNEKYQIQRKRDSGHESLI